MSRKAEARKIYEERVVNDSLARLAERLDLKGLPFSDEELKSLAKRHREFDKLGQPENSRLHAVWDAASRSGETDGMDSL